jgi:biopolymer transport protein ExbB
MNIVESTKHIMVGTGAAWVMWLLLALSVFSIAIILERAYTFWVRRDDVDSLRDVLARALRAGGFEQAREAMRRSRHPAAFVALQGMRRSTEETTAEEAQEAMAAEIAVQRGLLESRLGFLGTLGANAPFIGLFGTVIGVVQAFDELGKSTKAPSANTAQAALGTTPQLLNAISEALVATAVGILVAIPAVFAFNTFMKSMKSSLIGAEVLSRELLSFLHSDRGGQAGPQHGGPGHPGAMHHPGRR